MSFDASVAELAHRGEIHDLLMRYCRGIDLCDAEMVRSCYHEDALADHGFFSGRAHDFATIGTENLRTRFTTTKHYLMNEYVELYGDLALSESYVMSYLRMEREGCLYDLTVHCRYLDRIERRLARWKIAHRQVVSDGNRIDKVVEEAPHLNQGARGARFPDDPSLSFFGQLTGG